MRKSLLFLFAFLLLGTRVCEAAAPAAEKKAQLPVPIIALVDVQRVLQESVAAKNVQQQLEAQRARFQSEISREEASLRQAEQTLTQSRDKVAAEVYAGHEQQLRQKFLSVERHVQAKRKALDQAFTDSMNLVRKNLLDVVNVAAREHGANLVVVKQQALWSDPVLDITTEVLTRLNKTLSQVPVKVQIDEKP